MILRARVVLPVSRAPIDDGAIRLSGNRILAVGRYAGLSPQERTGVVDLGETMVLPGLVNAHCHLDYTDMGGRISRRKSFTEWIKAIVALKAEWSYADFAQSWLNGARMLLHNGVTSVADIETVPELLPEMWQATPLRVVSFREILGLRSRFAVKELVRSAVAEWEALPGQRDRVGLSPHAPYTTSSELLELSAHATAERNWPLTTHVSESDEEFDMFMSARGPLYDWLKSQRDMSDCGLGSPVQYLQRLQYLSPRLLAVHVNYLGTGDSAALGTHGVHVVHCPRSHAYFTHQPFPRAELARAGVNLCLGTDSLASVLKANAQPLELNLFAEMSALASAAPDLPPAEIIRMATINGAAALGRAGDFGELSPGSFADLIVLPCAANSPSAYEAVVHHPGAVLGSMIDGRWAREPALHSTRA